MLRATKYFLVQNIVALVKTDLQFHLMMYTMQFETSVLVFDGELCKMLSENPRGFEVMCFLILTRFNKI